MKGCFNFIISIIGLLCIGAVVCGALYLLSSGIQACSDSVDSYNQRSESARRQKEWEDPSSVRRWKVVNGKLRRDRAAEGAARGAIERQKQEIYNKQQEKSYKLCDYCGMIITNKYVNKCSNCNFTFICPKCSRNNKEIEKCSFCGYVFPEVNKYKKHKGLLEE